MYCAIVMMKMGQCSCYLWPFSFSRKSSKWAWPIDRLPAVDWTGTELVTCGEEYRVTSCCYYLYNSNCCEDYTHTRLVTL